MRGARLCIADLLCDNFPGGARVADHGGGYQYRLCPADSELTEECFQQTPLEFVKSEHKLLWNNGTLLAVLGEEKGVFVSGENVTFGPSGSTWARNPIPRVNTDNIGLVSTVCRMRLRGLVLNTGAFCNVLGQRSGVQLYWPKWWTRQSYLPAVPGAMFTGHGNVPGVQRHAGLALLVRRERTGSMQWRLDRWCDCRSSMFSNFTVPTLLTQVFSLTSRLLFISGCNSKDVEARQVCLGLALRLRRDCASVEQLRRRFVTCNDALLLRTRIIIPDSCVECYSPVVNILAE